jgi:hypothetical protein
MSQPVRDVRVLKSDLVKRTHVRFLPRCLIWSIVLSIALTIVLNLLIRSF